MGYKASTICQTAFDTIMGKYGKVYYRRDNTPTQYSWEYNVGKFHDGIWSFDCLGFVHTMVNNFCGDQSRLGGGALMDHFVLSSDEQTTLVYYCSNRGTFPQADIKPGSLLMQSDHVGLYIGEIYVPAIGQTINTAEVTMSMGGGGKLSWVDTQTGSRYTCKGGGYLSTWQAWGEFDRVEYDTVHIVQDGQKTAEKPTTQPATTTPTTTQMLKAGDHGVDLSYHQGAVDWEAFKAGGNAFAIIREGWAEDCNGQGVDPGFFDYAKGAQEAGVQVQIYHFLYGVCEEDAIENAKCAISNAKKAGLGTDTVIWLDIEYDIVDDAKKDYRGNVTLTNAMQRRMAEAFCDYILSQGYPTGIYTNLDYVSRVFGYDILQKYDVWLCDLYGDDDFPCVVRQYDWYHTKPGIPCAVDYDVWRGVYTVGTAKPRSGSQDPQKEPAKPEPIKPSTDKENTVKLIAGVLPVITRGAKGETVRTLQKILTKTGHYRGYIDGEAGRYTDNAIRAYQKDYALSVDGSFGPASWADILSRYTKHCAENLPVIQYGKTGEAVKALQVVLKKHGYYQGDIDGSAGPLTIGAIKAYQKEHSLTVDGSCGPATWSSILG